jgi:hypothetical protein
MKMTDIEKFVLDLRTLQAEVAKLTEHIDLDTLENDGLISRVGAWYAVENIHHLPDPARVKISDQKIVKGRLLVKFKKSSDFTRSQKKLGKILPR